MTRMVRESKTEAPELRLDPEQALQRLDWKAIFGTEVPVEVEIGIGKGRFLLAAAAARPDTPHVGVEWSNEYLRIAESRAAKRGMINVRFVRADARRLVHDAIASGSVSAYYVFYPDPWPKKRHQKRRFLQRETVDHLARTLRNGGWLHVSTDHADYWEAIRAATTGHPALAPWPTFGGPDFPLPTDEPLTNFEAKYLVEGRERFRASWRRVAGDWCRDTSQPREGAT
jgi:tRNA (guanine-N7-)-methyltransferase